MKAKKKLLLLLALLALVTLSCGTFTFTQEGYTEAEVDATLEAYVAEKELPEVEDLAGSDIPEIVLTIAQECWVKKTAIGDCFTQDILDKIFIGGEISQLEIRKIGDWEVTYPTRGWRVWDEIPGYRVTKAVKTSVSGDESLAIWDHGPGDRLHALPWHESVLFASTTELDILDIPGCQKIESFMFFYLCVDASEVNEYFITHYLPSEGSGVTVVYGSEKTLRKIITLAQFELDPSLLP